MKNSSDLLISKTLEKYMPHLWFCWFNCGRVWHHPKCVDGTGRLYEE